MNTPIALAAPDHAETVRREHRRAATTLNKGARVKCARWFSFYKAAADLEKTWRVQKFVLA